MSYWIRHPLKIQPPPAYPSGKATQGSPLLGALGIHIVAGEVIIKLLAVVLLLLLDVSEGVAHHGTCKFKNASVINARDVLFHRERIAAKVRIVFLFLLTNGRGRASKLAILRRRRRRGQSRV